MHYLFCLVFLVFAGWLAAQPGMWPGALILASVAIIMLVKTVRSKERRRLEPPRRRGQKRGRRQSSDADREGGND